MAPAREPFFVLIENRDISQIRNAAAGPHREDTGQQFDCGRKARLRTARNRKGSREAPPAQHRQRRRSRSEAFTGCGGFPQGGKAKPRALGQQSQPHLSRFSKLAYRRSGFVDGIHERNCAFPSPVRFKLVEKIDGGLARHNAIKGCIVFLLGHLLPISWRPCRTVTLRERVKTPSPRRGIGKREIS